MTDRHAAAYIRRSSTSGDSPGDASREAQTDTTRALAALHAPDAELRQYVDWGISGRRDDRPQYVRLKAAIEAGEVCCVFAYSLSRLGRSNGELDRFFKLCAAHDVTVFTKAEGALGKTSAMGGFLLTIMSAMAELESELAKERSEAARRVKQERGDVFGQPPYGYMFGRDADRRVILVPDPGQPIEPILSAYRDSRSVLGACRLLEQRGIPAPKGGKRWATSALTRIIEREAPEMLPQRNPVGRRTPTSARFAQLLRCPFCGRMLTPNAHRGQYYCANGPRHRATHPRYAVREADLMDWMAAEADRLDIPADVVTLEGIEARQDAIEARWQRARTVFVDSGDEAEYEAARKRYEADIAALRTQTTIADLPATLDWSWPSGQINAVLRSMWREVRLDESLRPTAAEWIIPEWRS